MGKYKKGDKFIIEINDELKVVGSEYGIYPQIYTMWGLNDLYFEEDDLDRLEHLERPEGYGEAKQDEIQVGDILRHDTTETEEMVVTDVHGEYVSGVCINGVINRIGSTFFEKPKGRWVKTGRHLDNVLEILLK